MSHKNNFASQGKTTTTTAKPQVTTYDSGHEHSIEHWIEVRLMVEEFEEESMAEPRAFAAGA